MPTRIAIINRIIITVTVKVKSIYGFVVEVSSIIGRYKSTPFGGVVTCVKEIPTTFLVEIIATVSDGVGFREESVFKGIGNNRMIAISIITVFG